MKLLTGTLHLPSGEVCRRVMFLTPPQHGKSTIVSQLFPSVSFGIEPALKLILLSYSSDLAQSHSVVARGHAQQFRGQMGDRFALHPSIQSAGHWRTTAGGYLIAAGIRGTVAGRAADGIIIDDPIKNDEEAMSPTIREKIWRNYSSVAETRLSPTGFVALVTTPWHDEDLRGRLIETEPDDWLVYRFPALCDDPTNDPLGRAFDEPLWPERYPLEWYLEKKRHLEERGLVHQWHSLYQCAPKGDGTPREFADFCPVPEYRDEITGPITVLSCDPSKSKTDSVGDYAAFTHITADATRPPHLWVKSWALRTSANQVSSTAIELINRLRPTGFAIETTMFQSLFYDKIFDAINAMGIPCRMFSYVAPQHVDKKSKIRVMVGHLLQQKRLHLYHTSPGTRLFQQQLRNFPHDKEHDDLPDALCMGMWCLEALGIRGLY